jgi:transcription antitermination factor NusG
MPVLEKEPTVWPSNLFESKPSVAADAEWCVLHTRSRTEKSVARYLRGESLSYFLPQHEQARTYQRRTVRSYLPLFPGYVFAHIDEESVFRCRQRREIVNLLKVQNQDLFEEQIRGIHSLLDSGSPVTREERLEPGMAAQIVRGPLKGLQGQVLKNHRGGLRFVLEVQFIQQAASVEVDGDDIRAL